MRIVFMGTPEFAVASLQTLVKHHYSVVGVITMPDKPAGRGHQVQQSPVKQYAVSQGIPVLQPLNLKDDSFLDELRSLKADLQIVVAFRMLPEIVWNMPPMGTFNLHASLLPQYRGAAPINWAVINGEKETGVTTFFLQHEIDTGNIILQEKVAISEEDNAGTVHDRLMMLGADVVRRTVDLILAGGLVAVDQTSLLDPDETPKMAPKIFKETCELTIDLSTIEFHNKVRGLSPYPGAWMTIIVPGHDAITLKIFETMPEIIHHDLTVGTVVTDGSKMLSIALKDGYIRLLNVQAPGKKRMETGEWLRGLR